jgi:hypothetical protein
MTRSGKLKKICTMRVRTTIVLHPISALSEVNFNS